MSGTAERRYSGEHSEKFWARIKRLPAEYNREAYALGIVLQTVEHQVFAAIEAGERAKKVKRVTR